MSPSLSCQSHFQVFTLLVSLAPHRAIRLIKFHVFHVIGLTWSCQIITLITSLLRVPGPNYKNPNGLVVSLPYIGFVAQISEYVVHVQKGTYSVASVANVSVFR